MNISANSTKECPSCKKQLPADAVFCGYDGALLPTAAKQDGAPGAMVCPQCQKDFPSYARFCPADSVRLVQGGQLQSSGAPDPSQSSGGGGRSRTGTAFIDNANLSEGANLQPADGAPPYLQESGPNQPAVQNTNPNPVGTNQQPVESENNLIGGDFQRSEQVSSSSSPQTDEHLLASTSGYLGNLIGKTVDKYLIQSMIGEGGMAVVYKAHHTIMERTVVIKVMQGWLLSNKKSVERFMRECKVTAQLNHPNIVTVYDVGAINSKAPYLVMEYIKGEALADRIQRQGALSFKTVANIVIQICRGLQEAHNHGIIHRDLKPDNILLQDKSDRPDWVKIVDFGISHFAKGEGQRLTKTGRMVGTPEYIAPEQLKDKPMDNRTDLYAIGIIMYEMLTGKVPFEGESAESILMKHLLEEPTPMVKHKPEFKDGTPFDEIIARLLKKEPDERFQTATELRLAVEQVASRMRSGRS